MKKINKYDNGGDPPKKKPVQLQFDPSSPFNPYGSPGYSIDVYNAAITRDSTALEDMLQPGLLARMMGYDEPLMTSDYADELSKRLLINRVNRNYLKPYTKEELDKINLRKNGGKSMDVDYEAEGGEVVIGDISVNRKYNGGTAKQYKGANMFMLGGPRHEKGGIGIKVNSEEPSYVFTDRLKVGGMKGATYADMAAKFGNELDNVTTMAMGGDKYDRTTAKLMRPRLMEDVEDLFNDQEEFKRENNIDQEPKEAGLGAAFAAMATKAGLSKGLAAAQFLPGLINIGKGLFGKAPELEYDTIVPEMQDYQDFNPLMQSYLGQQNRSLATLRAGLEGSGISGAGLRGSFQAGISGSQANAANFLSQLGQMQAQSDRATDQFNISQQTAAQQANMQAEMMADQFAMQNDPSRAFSQGLSQILGTATSLSRQGLQRDLLNRMFPAAYGGKYGIK